MLMAMTLRLTAEQDHDIDEMSRALGVSKHKFVMEAINNAIRENRRKTEVLAIAQDLKSEFGEVLERLADA